MKKLNYLIFTLIFILICSLKVNAGSIVVNSGSDYFGKWQGNSNGNPGYVLLYDGHSGPTSNFKHGTYPFIYASNIFMSIINAGVNDSVSYIAEVQVCQTTTDTSLEYDSGSAHTQITNIQKLRSTKSGSCSINVYTGNLYTYYFLVTGKAVSYTNPESNVGFDNQSYVLRWTSDNYIEFSIKNVEFSPYTTELYNAILEGKTLDEIENQNQTIINQNQQQIQQDQQQHQETMNTITSSTVDSPNNSFSEFESYLPENGVITQLITLPISLFQRVLSSINGTCSQYNLGNLMGTDLILPCINISNYIGTTLWNVIDILFSGLFVLVIGKKMIKAFNSFSSMEEGDVLD